MKIKIILGIVLPLILILFLAIIASLDVGFSVKKTFIKEITIEDVFSEGQLRNIVKIGEIEIKNDYFLGKRYDLNQMLACLVDAENVKTTISAGSITYSEGNSQPIDAIYYDQYRSTNVEVSANGNKNVLIYLTPQYRYSQDYSQLLQEYKDFDELVLVDRKPENNLLRYPNYQDCHNLQPADLSSGIRIPLILN